MQKPKNLGLKAISIFFALVLSYFVNSEGGASVVSYTVPIEFQNVPEKRILVNSTAKEVDVTVSGPSFIVSKMLSEARSLKVRIPEGAGDRYRFLIETADLGLPPSVNVISMEPREVEVSLDERITRELPVIVPSFGAIGASYRSEISTSPSTVTVTGPKTEVQALTRVETVPIDLRDLTETRTEELRVRNPGSRITISSATVRAVVTVAAVERERRFGRLAIEVRGGESGGIALSPSVASVVVVGPAEAVKKITNDQVVPYVRIAEGSTGDNTLPVLVEVPDGIAVIAVEPESVAVNRASRSKAGAGRAKQ